MTTKELTYIEDALAHQKQMQTICNDAAQRIQDQELKNYVTQLATKHQECYGKFFQLLNQ